MMALGVIAAVVIYGAWLGVRAWRRPQTPARRDRDFREQVRRYEEEIDG